MYKLLIGFVLALMASAQYPSGLVDKYSIQVLKAAEARSPPTKGNSVKVHYTGTLLSGKKFDSSKDRNQPFDFRVGTGSVITCWDEVVSEMSVGDHIIVTCPSQTAYGSRAIGPIPANSDLKFEIERLG